MSLVRSSIIVSVISLLVSVISFFSQILIANYFGASGNMDTYLIGSSIPLLISALLSSGLSYSLTPHLVKAKIKHERAYDQYLGEMLKKISIYVFFLFLLAAIVNMLSFRFVYSMMTDDIYWLSIKICAISWVSSFFSIILGFLNSVFNVEKIFTTPILLSVAVYLCIIIFCILFHKEIGTLAISYGLLAGTSFSILIAYYFLKNKIRFFPSVESHAHEMKTFFSALPSVSIAMLCFSIYQTIDAFWAPRLGTSNLSYLGYCQRILIAVGALVITGPSTVLVPRLAESIDEGRRLDFLTDIGTLLKLILSLASMVALVGSILSTEVVTILFQRGQFSAENTNGIARILPFMLSGMVFMLCVVMLFRAFFAMGINKEVILIGVSSSVFYFAFSGIGAFYLGISGISIAYLSNWILICIISVSYIFKENPKMILNKKTFEFIIKQSLLLLITGLVTYLVRYLIKTHMHSTIFNNSFVILNLTGLVGVAIFFILSLTFIPQYEIINLFNKIGLRIKK
jgi:putative peptidoglycan lipid II flippase